MWYKQKAVIEFLHHKGVRLIEIQRCLKMISSDQTLDVSKVRYRLHMAIVGPQKIFDNARSDWPKLRQSERVVHCEFIKKKVNVNTELYVNTMRKLK